MIDRFRCWSWPRFEGKNCLECCLVRSTRWREIASTHWKAARRRWGAVEEVDVVDPSLDILSGSVGYRRRLAPASNADRRLRLPSSAFSLPQLLTEYSWFYIGCLRLRWLPLDPLSSSAAVSNCQSRRVILACASPLPLRSWWFLLALPLFNTIKLCFITVVSSSISSSTHQHLCDPWQNIYFSSIYVFCEWNHCSLWFYGN